MKKRKEVRAPVVNTEGRRTPTQHVQQAYNDNNGLDQAFCEKGKMQKCSFIDLS